MNGPFGVQLSCFRSSFSQGMESIFGRIADIGFDSVEMCGPEELKSEECKALCANSLRIEGWHCGIDGFLNNYDKTAEFHKSVGNDDIIIPWADLSDKSKLCDLIGDINAIAPRLKKDGFYLSYHNHSHEFEKFSDKYIIDILADECKDLYFEPDVYWIKNAGCDPVEFIEKYLDRIRIVHLKNGHGGDEFDSLDNGIVDIESVIKAALNSGINRFVVENDSPNPDPETNFKRSLEFLKNLNIER